MKQSDLTTEQKVELIRYRGHEYYKNDQIEQNFIEDMKRIIKDTHQKKDQVSVILLNKGWKTAVRVLESSDDPRYTQFQEIINTIDKLHDEVVACIVLHYTSTRIRKDDKDGLELSIQEQNYINEIFSKQEQEQERVLQ